MAPKIYKRHTVKNQNEYLKLYLSVRAKSFPFQLVKVVLPVLLRLPCWFIVYDIKNLI